MAFCASDPRGLVGVVGEPTLHQEAVRREATFTVYLLDPHGEKLQRKLLGISEPPRKGM